MDKMRVILSILVVCCLVFALAGAVGCGNGDNGDDIAAEAEDQNGSDSDSDTESNDEADSQDGSNNGDSDNSDSDDADPDPSTNPDPQTQSDTTPPTVISVSPADGADGVEVSTVINAIFSESMNASTITTSTFEVTGTEGTVSGNVTYVDGDTDGPTATFTPSSDLQDLSTYTAVVTTGVEDLNGNHMEADLSWSFTTGDITAPVISSIQAWDFTASTAEISWETDEPATSVVEYGQTDAYGSTAGSATEYVKNHSVTLTDLSSVTTYHYRIVTSDGTGNEAFSDDAEFTTTDVFVISNLVITPEEASVYEKVTVSVDITNHAVVTRTYEIWLKIDGESEESKEIVVNAGDTDTISFTPLVIERVGSYLIEIGELEQTLAVNAWAGVPVQNIGDTWIYEATLDSDEVHTITAEIVGNGTTDGRDCYVMDVVIDPPELDDGKYRIERATVKIDKATGLPLRIDAEAQKKTIFGWVSSPVRCLISYEFPGAIPYPLYDGKEFRVIMTIDINASSYHKTEVRDCNCVVEKVEDRTVEAGLFKDCFKLVMHDNDNDGDVIGILWISDEVGLFPVEAWIKETADSPETEAELVEYTPAS